MNHGGNPHVPHIVLISLVHPRFSTLHLHAQSMGPLSHHYTYSRPSVTILPILSSTCPQQRIFGPLRPLAHLWIYSSHFVFLHRSIITPSTSSHNNPDTNSAVAVRTPLLRITTRSPFVRHQRLIAADTKHAYLIQPKSPATPSLGYPVTGD